MRLGPLKLTQVRLAVVLLHDRLAVAALAGERVEAFTIATENPAVVLREELAARQLTPRAVALALSRSAVFVRPMELPVVGGDMREMVRLNLDGHLPSAGDETAFDYVPLPAEADGVRREDTLQRVLVVAAEPRAVEAALRIAEESRLRPASLFLRVVGDGSDKRGLVGKVKDEEALSAIGAEAYMTSVLFDDAAYDVEAGFLATLGEVPGGNALVLALVRTLAAP